MKRIYKKGAEKIRWVSWPLWSWFSRMFFFLSWHKWKLCRIIILNNILKSNCLKQKQTSKIALSFTPIRLITFPLLKYTEKTIFPFPFILNGIRSLWQFSFHFWTKWNSIWFKIERKTVIMKGNGNTVFPVQRTNCPSQSGDVPPIKGEWVFES